MTPTSLTWDPKLIPFKLSPMPSILSSGGGVFPSWMEFFFFFPPCPFALCPLAGVYTSLQPGFHTSFCLCFPLPLTVLQEGSTPDS